MDGSVRPEDEMNRLLLNRSTKLSQGSQEMEGVPRGISGSSSRKSRKARRQKSIRLGDSKSVGRKGSNSLGNGTTGIDDDDDDFCPTCLESYDEDNPKIFSACGHHFHLACIYEWLERSRTCPVCLTPMRFEEES